MAGTRSNQAVPYFRPCSFPNKLRRDGSVFLAIHPPPSRAPSVIFQSQTTGEGARLVSAPPESFRQPLLLCPDAAGAAGEAAAGWNRQRTGGHSAQKVAAPGGGFPDAQWSSLLGLSGGPAMRGYLVAIFLSAVFLYYVLHCILWGTNVYWVPPVEMKRRNKIQPCLSKPAFASLLRYRQFHPFLCASDFKKIASLYNSDKFDLPYGIKTSAEYFRVALSKLQSCDLFDEFDKHTRHSTGEDEAVCFHKDLQSWKPYGAVLLCPIGLLVPCKRCVVVGNGGILKNKTLGEKIDSYDVIIRMNNGPVLGHEEEVGRRTTFRLFYPESVFSDPIHSEPNTTVILTAFKPLDLKWLWELLTGGKINSRGFWKKPASNLIYTPYQIRILDPFITRTAAYELLHFPKVFPKNQKPKHPTTGIIAITLAFHICHEVHIAGFKYNFSDLRSPLHYYGNATMSLMSKNAYHNVTAEQLFLKDIIEKNYVINLTQE